MSEGIPHGWQFRQLGEFAREIKDKNGSNGSIPVLSVTKYDGFVHSLEYFKKQVFSRDTSGYKKVTKGDFAYATIHLDEGSLGLLKDWDAGLISPMYTVFRVNNKLNPDFLFFLMKSDEYMRKYPALGQGSINRRASISFSTLSQLDIHYPSLLEQQKIAAILTSVDEVIEKTTAQIDKLQDLKKGMMQELLTKGIGHTEFKDSPVGRIPKGWEIASIDDLSDFVTSGSRGWAQYYSTSGALFIRIGNLTREHINFRFEDAVHVTPPDSAEGKRTLVQPGDILISITADLGIIGIVDDRLGEAYVNQHIALVRLKDKKKVNSRWIGHFLSTKPCHEQFITNNDSGAKAGLNLTSIRQTLTALPPTGEQDRISGILDSVDTNIKGKRDKLVAVTKIKKALMQDLLTGKVRVD